MGRRIYSEAINHGRNQDRGRNEDRFVRCSRCRWICKVKRDRQADVGSTVGWGMAFVDDSVNPIDPTVTAGCPQCGTYLYNK